MNQASHEIAEFKAVVDDPQGLFAARVSVIGNVDRNGDRVMPGAFTKTLERWRASGKKIPVIWSHEHKDPNAYIGFVDPSDVKESNEDLIVAGQLDVKGNPLAARAFELLQQGLVNEWSFAYKVNDEKVGKDLAREIHELDLFEVGPTLIGANDQTLTLATKEAVPVVSVEDARAALNLPPLATNTNGTVTVNVDVVPDVDTTKIGAAVDQAVASLDAELENLIESKIGRVISRRTEQKIRDAVSQLSQILSSLDEEKAPPTADSPSEQAAAEEPTSPGETELARRRIEQTGLFLMERNR